MTCVWLCKLPRFAETPMHEAKASEDADQNPNQAKSSRPPTIRMSSRQFEWHATETNMRQSSDELGQNSRELAEVRQANSEQWLNPAKLWQRLGSQVRAPPAS